MTLIRVDQLVVFQPLPVRQLHNVPTLIRRMGLAGILLALIVMALIPTQSFGMELKVAGTQLILSGPVVGDEPGKVREALAAEILVEDNRIAKIERSVGLIALAALSIHWLSWTPIRPSSKTTGRIISPNVAIARSSNVPVRT